MAHTNSFDSAMNFELQGFIREAKVKLFQK